MHYLEVPLEYTMSPFQAIFAVFSIAVGLLLIGRAIYIYHWMETPYRERYYRVTYEDMHFLLFTMAWLGLVIIVGEVKRLQRV